MTMNFLLKLFFSYFGLLYLLFYRDKCCINIFIKIFIIVQQIKDSHIII